MRIETKYQEGLKKLLKEKSLDEINVVMLCDSVKSNRQTFYYHYRDISDVVESILLKEKIGYGKKLFDFESITKAAVAFINSNYIFLNSIYNSYASDKINSYFYSYFYQHIAAFQKNDKKINSDSVRYMCNLFSNELVYWIANKRRESQSNLIKRFIVLWDYFTKQYRLDLSKLVSK